MLHHSRLADQDYLSDLQKGVIGVGNPYSPSTGIIPMKTSEYAKSGVDYSLMEPFKMAMIEAGKKTLVFPNKRGVYVVKDAIHAHGAVYEYRGTPKQSLRL